MAASTPAASNPFAAVTPPVIIFICSFFLCLFSTDIYFNAADGTITANGFNGKASSAGTADTAASCSGTAANANKVNQSLTIQLNGTNQGAWNGSSAKTINITPSSIGAPTTADVAKATDTEVDNMLTTIFG